MRDLGGRNKGYDATTSMVLMGRTPTILRVDGNALHSFTKGAASFRYHDLSCDGDPIRSYRRDFLAEKT